ncbi:cytochrome c3 family protein [Thermodesulfatator autotrophicus]|uniref:Doubled CXXCH motif domain-containing protein n=1 Tax=Thermodesulfatator autotrophicus TaxID=1795632 RepID=A0A177E5F6_9BACT|nr:cytochrome c3 family protein [Thermodesulfatator autotrophicus]OAG26680.1 hypothetical protein TH606_11035 [Thermodesulfatator autotrophicus]
MIAHFFNLFFLCSLFFILSMGVVLAKLNIVSPPDKVWVTEEKIFLAGFVEDNQNIKKISFKGAKVILPKDGKLLFDGQTFGAILSLKEGLNKIEVSSGKDKIVLDIFFLSEKYQKRGKKVPEGFKRFYVHKDPSLISCKECHVTRRGKLDLAYVSSTPANCTTGKCHSDKGKEKYVHGPVGAKVCITCHSPHGSFYRLSLERQGQELCFACHEIKREEFNKKIIHSPVEEGCIDCHDPHESAMRFQLKGDGQTLSSLCFNCHEKELFTKKHVHGPIGTGDCIACHNPHSSNFQSLLMAPPEKGEVCFLCHTDRKEDFSMEFVHEPAVEDCSQCHDPHSSDNRFQLIMPGASLCKTCHEEISPEVFSAMNEKYFHKPVKDGNCTACHKPHSANYSSLLISAQEVLCFSCHVDLGDYIKSSRYKHGPVETGDCVACHNVHGSKYVSLLIRYFPPAFYTDYKPEYYDLCFGCHNREIAKTKFTSILTNFRDGEWNLHYLHVHRKKGRTCIACHDPHASDQAKHIRPEVPFGMWSYPIKFTLNPNGGTCVVGCHAPKSYNRLKPVNWNPDI